MSFLNIYIIQLIAVFIKRINMLGISFAEGFSKSLADDRDAIPYVKKSEGRVSDFSRKIEGKYANFSKVGYKAFKFVLDFGQKYYENDKAELYNRVILAAAFGSALHAFWNLQFKN